MTFVAPQYTAPAIHIDIPTYNCHVARMAPNVRSESCMALKSERQKGHGAECN